MSTASPPAAVAHALDGARPLARREFVAMLAAAIVASWALGLATLVAIGSWLRHGVDL